MSLKHMRRHLLHVEYFVLVELRHVVDLLLQTLAPVSFFLQRQLPMVLVRLDLILHSMTPDALNFRINVKSDTIKLTKSLVVCHYNHYRRLGVHFSKQAPVGRMPPQQPSLILPLANTISHHLSAVVYPRNCYRPHTLPVTSHPLGQDVSTPSQNKIWKTKQTRLTWHGLHDMASMTWLT